MCKEHISVTYRQSLWKDNSREKGVVVEWRKEGGDQKKSPMKSGI